MFREDEVSEILSSFSLVAGRIWCALCLETKAHAVVTHIINCVLVSMGYNSMELMLLDMSQKRVLWLKNVGNCWDDSWNIGGVRVGWKECQEANGLSEGSRITHLCSRHGLIVGGIYFPAPRLGFGSVSCFGQ